MLKGSCVITACLLFGLGVGGPAAAADRPKCHRLTLICDDQSKSPGSTKSVDPAKTSKGRTCTAEGRTVPCSGKDGNWVDQYECYMRVASEQPAPPPGKSEGAWYECTWLPGAVDGFTSQTFWLDQPPTVDPAQLARDLLARIQLQRVGIGITPEPGKTGLLGLPTYLWVANPGARTLGPISDSVTEGGVTVTLTARVGRVVWDLGDGVTITCTGAGTPYRDEFGARPSPTCGHVYKHPSTALPGGAYHVTATAVWDVAWTGGGQNGVIPFEVTSETSIRMSEAQALN